MNTPRPSERARELLKGAYDTHITAAHTKQFRDQLTPMSGALYDERLYRAL